MDVANISAVNEKCLKYVRQPCAIAKQNITHGNVHKPKTNAKEKKEVFDEVIKIRKYSHCK